MLLQTDKSALRHLVTHSGPQTLNNKEWVFAGVSFHDPLIQEDQLNNKYSAWPVDQQTNLSFNTIHSLNAAGYGY